MTNNENKTNRKKTRKLLFQELYANCFLKQDNELFKDSFYFRKKSNFVLDKKYFDEMMDLIYQKEWYLLKIISLLAPKFKVEMMSLSFILPVFIGACEMLYLQEEIPALVSINEAVELSKIYWDDSSRKLVNWIMHKLYKDLDSIKKELENFDWNFGVSILKR